MQIEIFSYIQPIFHLANLFARREAKTRFRHRNWLKLTGGKIRREQVGTFPSFLSVRVNKFTTWKKGLRHSYMNFNLKNSLIIHEQD